MGASLAAGFYKLLKILQYETVLGENDPDSKDLSGKGDEEKNIDSSGGAIQDGPSKSSGADGDWQVSGPGLGDLHTAGETTEVSIATSRMQVGADGIEIRVKPWVATNDSTTRLH